MKYIFISEKVEKKSFLPLSTAKAGLFMVRRRTRMFPAAELSALFILSFIRHMPGERREAFLLQQIFWEDMGNETPQ